jgi:hypothetical protein
MAHTAPMLVEVKEKLQPSDVVFLGMIETRRHPTIDSSSDKYLVKRQFFIDTHDNLGIEEAVSVGVIDDTPGNKVYALGVWEVVRMKGTDKVQIKPTWDYSHQQLEHLLETAGYKYEAFSVYHNNQAFLMAAEESSRQVA